MRKKYTKYLVVSEKLYIFASKLHKQWKEATYINIRIRQ